MSESNLLELPFSAPPPPELGRILVSDAFELLRGLAPESVDLVVTDPPYESLQIHRARGTTTRLTTNWFTTVPNERLPELLREVYRVLRPDRHFYLFCDEVTADVIKQQQKVGAARLPNGGRKCSCGFVYWKEIVWAKTTLDGGRIRGGTGYHYRAASERILFFEKGKRALNDLGTPDVLLAPRAGGGHPGLDAGVRPRCPGGRLRRGPGRPPDASPGRTGRPRARLLTARGRTSPSSRRGGPRSRGG